VGRESQLERALAALTLALNECGAPWMVIGGVAIIASGVRRFTTDIDAVVQGDAVSVPALLRFLKRHDIAPRIEGARAFAEENLVLLLRHQGSGVDLDVSLGWTSFEREALEERVLTALGTVKAPMARPEDLVVLKVFAGRPRDFEDVDGLLALYPRMDLERVRARLSEMALLAGAPEILDGFESAVARRLSPPRPRKRNPTKTRARRRPRR
jgi:Nucleotidyl transferase of unknown function (DUF2204)